MKLVFCGTPDFAVPSLERLAAAGYDIPLVVTQPDRPQGRGMELAAPPVKQSALKLQLPVLQPEKIKKNEEFQAALAAIRPDAIIVVGYGRIVPPWMLNLPPLGNINVHASLLPKYRGAAPVQWAVANGEKITGVTTMRLDEGLDTGDILLQCEMEIRPDDTSLTLWSQLAAMGAGLLVETIRGLEQRAIVPRPQDHTQATLAPILKKEDGLIDFNRTARQIYDRLRGFQPWPGAYTIFRGKNLKIVAARVANASPEFAAGVLQAREGKLVVGCGESTTLELIQLQPEGRKPLSARDFINGYRLTAGERLG